MSERAGHQNRGSGETLLSYGVDVPHPCHLRARLDQPWSGSTPVRLVDWRALIFITRFFFMLSES